MPKDRAFIDARSNTWFYSINGRIMSGECALSNLRDQIASDNAIHDYLLELRLLSPNS